MWCSQSGGRSAKMKDELFIAAEQNSLIKGGADKTDIVLQFCSV